MEAAGGVSAGNGNASASGGDGKADPAGGGKDAASCGAGSNDGGGCPNHHGPGSSGGMSRGDPVDVVTFVRDAHGNVTEYVDERGLRSQARYDAWGRCVESVDSPGRRVQLTDSNTGSRARSAFSSHALHG